MRTIDAAWAGPRGCGRGSQAHGGLQPNGLSGRKKKRDDELAAAVAWLKAKR